MNAASELGRFGAICGDQDMQRYDDNAEETIALDFGDFDMILSQGASSEHSLSHRVGGTTSKSGLTVLANIRGVGRKTQSRHGKDRSVRP